MADRLGRVLYVGKARNLKKRVASYFRPPEQLAPKTRALMSHTDSVEVTVTHSEDRGASAREQPDQGASPSLQHRAEGRQELSVHPRHDGRCISAAGLPSRSTTGDGSLLRSVRERRRDAQHPGPVAETVPRPPVRGFVLREPHPTLPATPDRPLHRPVRPADRRGDVRRGRATRHHVPRRQERGDARRTGAPDGIGVARARIRAGRTLSRSDRQPEAGAGPAIRLGSEGKRRCRRGSRTRGHSGDRAIRHPQRAEPGVAHAAPDTRCGR